MSQLITGGLGGLGVLMASWFAQLDRHIHLVDTRNYHTSPIILQNAQSQASIKIARGDICTAENASCAMKFMETPTFGILHAAGILQVRDNAQATMLFRCLTLEGLHKDDGYQIGTYIYIHHTLSGLFKYGHVLQTPHASDMMKDSVSSINTHET